MKSIITNLILVVAFFLVTNANAQTHYLYGMTLFGGTYGNGILFHLNESNNSFTIDTNFDNNANPLGGLMKASDGMLYGMTQTDGTYSSGTLFRLDPSNGHLTTLVNFDDVTQGSMPNGDLIQASNGLLYGMTSSGGSNGSGTLFSYDISTNILTPLVNFDINAQPWGTLLQGSNGLLYGLTTFDGTNNAGTIFTFNTVTNAFNVIYNFPEDNNQPIGAVYNGESLIQATNGYIYGMTGYAGINNDGTIFRLNDTTNVVTIVYSFNIASGIVPQGGLIQASNGLFYGLTSA